jgi:hypothetical protein
MIITLPCRRMTLHLSQIFLTLGRTFIRLSRPIGRLRGFGARPGRLLVSVSDPTPLEVVWRELNLDPITRKDPDVVHPHLA